MRTEHTLAAVPVVLPIPKRQTRARSEGVKWLTQEETRAILEAARRRSARDYLLLALCYRFGLRVSEAVTLRADAVDLKRREIRVRGLKGGLERTYTVPLDLLRPMRAWKPTGPTFLHGRQGPLTRARAWQVFKRAGSDAGVDLEGVGIHALRHTAAVHALDAGLGLEDVRDLLRHRRPTSTAVYANCSTRRRDDYLRRLEESPAIVKLR